MSLSHPSDLTPKSDLDKEAGKQNALIVQFRELDKKAESWIASWNPYHPSVIKHRGFKPVAIDESRVRVQAARIFLVAFGIFMLWAFFAPLDAGVSSSGTVVVSGYRKQLQHPTGGVVKEILIKEGDVVNEGDVLIRINPLQAQADLSAAELQYINAIVSEARLHAERNGDSKITWPKELDPWQGDEKLEEAKRIQQKLFDTRRTEFAAVINSKRAQLATLSEEASGNSQLAKEGYVSKAQANASMRTKLDAEQSLTSTQRPTKYIT